MDKTTKCLLALIAAALWVNIGIALVPTAATAQSNELRQINSNLAAIYNGICINRKIC